MHIFNLPLLPAASTAQSFWFCWLLFTFRYLLSYWRPVHLILLFRSSSHELAMSLKICLWKLLSQLSLISFQITLQLIWSWFFPWHLWNLLSLRKIYLLNFVFWVLLLQILHYLIVHIGDFFLWKLYRFFGKLALCLRQFLAFFFRNGSFHIPCFTHKLFTHFTLFANSLSWRWRPLVFLCQGSLTLQLLVGLTFTFLIKESKNWLFFRILTIWWLLQSNKIIFLRRFNWNVFLLRMFNLKLVYWIRLLVKGSVIRYLYLIIIQFTLIITMWLVL